jgi:hypothetical protein
MADYEDFNPEENYEDAEAIDHAKRMMKAAQYLQQKEAQKNNDQFLNQLWSETLQEEGLDPQTYGTLAGQDPELSKAKIKEGMKTIISGVKKGRDSQGRFVSKTQPGKPTDSNTTIEAMKEKSKRGALSEQDELSVLDAIFGADPLWKD